MIVKYLPSTTIIYRYHLKLDKKYSNSKDQDKKSFYKRKLPQNLISLSSAEGKKIFNESMQQGNCESFFTLVQQFVTQNEPTTCGTATLSMVLNSLKIDPGIKWKGIWRWYDDYNIKGMKKDMIQKGITLEEYHNLAKINHSKSMVFSPLEGQVIKNQFIRQSNIGFFRNSVIACTQRVNMIMTINFYRKVLNQTGAGHFGPIAAYNSNRDLVLVFDVAKFKYESYWCSIDMLYQALKEKDTTSKISRGFIINKKSYKNQIEPLSPFCLFETDMKRSQKLRKIFQTNKQQTYFKKLVITLNDISFHPLLIPLLYQVYVLEEENKKLILNFAEQQFTYTDIIQFLNQDAQDLIQIFSHSNKDAFYFLLKLFRLADHPSQEIEQKNYQRYLKYLGIFGNPRLKLVV